MLYKALLLLSLSIVPTFASEEKQDVKNSAQMKKSNQPDAVTLSTDDMTASPYNVPSDENIPKIFEILPFEVFYKIMYSFLPEDLSERRDILKPIRSVSKEWNKWVSHEENRWVNEVISVDAKKRIKSTADIIERRAQNGEKAEITKKDIQDMLEGIDKSKLTDFIKLRIDKIRDSRAQNNEIDNLSHFMFASLNNACKIGSIIGILKAYFVADTTMEKVLAKYYRTTARIQSFGEKVINRIFKRSSSLSSRALKYFLNIVFKNMRLKNEDQQRTFVFNLCKNDLGVLGELDFEMPEQCKELLSIFMELYKIEFSYFDQPKNIRTIIKELDKDFYNFKLVEDFMYHIAESEIKPAIAKFLVNERSLVHLYADKSFIESLKSATFREPLSRLINAELDSGTSLSAMSYGSIHANLDKLINVFKERKYSEKYFSDSYSLTHYSDIVAHSIINDFLIEKLLSQINWNNPCACSFATCLGNLAKFTKGRNDYGCVRLIVKRICSILEASSVTGLKEVFLKRFNFAVAFENWKNLIDEKATPKTVSDPIVMKVKFHSGDFIIDLDKKMTVLDMMAVLKASNNIPYYMPFKLVDRDGSPLLLEMLENVKCEMVVVNLLNNLENLMEFNVDLEKVGDRKTDSGMTDSPADICYDNWTRQENSIAAEPSSQIIAAQDEAYERSLEIDREKDRLAREEAERREQEERDRIAEAQRLADQQAKRATDFAVAFKKWNDLIDARAISKTVSDPIVMRVVSKSGSFDITLDKKMTVLEMMAVLKPNFANTPFKFVVRGGAPLPSKLDDLQEQKVHTVFLDELEELMEFNVDLEKAV
jgi:hypothetical protein